MTYVKTWTRNQLPLNQPLPVLRANCYYVKSYYKQNLLCLELGSYIKLYVETTQKCKIISV